MRRALFVVVAPCSGSNSHMEQPPPSGPDAPVADASTIDSSDNWFARIPNAIAVGTTTLAWSEKEAPCGQDGGEGCHGPGPMITVANTQGQVSTPLTGMLGTRSIVGDETGWFYFDYSTAAIMRLVDGGTPVKFAAPMLNLPVGPFVDATYVYWFEIGTGRGLVRASRTGDGSDATTLVQPPAIDPKTPLYTFAGDVWWGACSQSCDVYRASSTTPAYSGARLEGVDASALYLVEPGTTWNLRSMARDGTITTLLANQPQNTAPLHVIADGGELFWAANGSIYRAVANGAPTHVVDTDSQGDNLITVTPTQILYNFTPSGFAAVAR